MAGAILSAMMLITLPFQDQIGFDKGAIIGTRSPDFVDKYASYALEKAKKSGVTDVPFAAQAEEMAKFKEMYKNPLVNIALTLIEPLPVGLVFTVFTAVVLSRKRRIEGYSVA